MGLITKDNVIPQALSGHPYLASHGYSPSLVTWALPPPRASSVILPVLIMCQRITWPLEPQPSIGHWIPALLLEVSQLMTKLCPKPLRFIKDECIIFVVTIVIVTWHVLSTS